MGVLNDEVVKIVELLGEQDRGDGGLQDGGVVGPAEDFDDTVRVSAAEGEGVALGDDELGELDDDGDFESRGDPCREPRRLRQRRR